MASIRTPKSVQRRDPAIYQDTTQHGDRLIALRAYRLGCRCDLCKGNMREERRRWREKHGSYQTSPERKREQNRAYLYGMKPGQYEQMLADQHNYCKICGEHKAEELVVDHCHDSGEIRGLLCARCNTLLGMAKDSETMLASAIEYLQQARRGYAQHYTRRTCEA